MEKATPWGKQMCLTAHFELSTEARDYLSPSDTCWSLLDKLTSANLWLDALRLIAYTLPKPDAVRWACVCVSALQIPLSASQQAALAATHAWLATMGETERRLAFAAANAAGLDNGAGCAALAAFWSGGSMAPDGVPAVPPAEHLCHHAAACAAILAGVVAPERAASTYQQFIALGKEMLPGKKT